MSQKEPVRIEKVVAHAVRVPLKSRLLTSYGSRKSVSRTILQLHTNTDLIGYGEVHGRVTPGALKNFEKTVVGKSPWKITEITCAIKNWSYYPYQKPEPLMAAFEIACLDLQGKIAEVPLYDLLGGKSQQRVPVAGYIFYAHADEDGKGQVHSVDEVVAAARAMVDEYGFGTLKLKGGYFSPEHDLAAMEALRDTFGKDVRLRIDPQGSWTPTTAIRIGRGLDRLGIEYFEDPCWGAPAMARVKSCCSSPLATNMCVTNFDELMPAVSMGAVDVVLADPWYWGGVRNAQAMEKCCAALGLDVGMHSGSELGIAWTAMVHLASAMPHLRCAIDCMHIHLGEDIIKNGESTIVDGHIAPTEGFGLGIDVDSNTLNRFTKLASADGLADRLLNPSLADSERPGWSPRMPAW